MTRDEFQQFIERGVVLLDGATGTNLQKAGMPVGVCPEQWILEHADTMIDLQSRFVAQGTNILYAPTFTGNRIKLAEYGLEDRLKEINGALVALSRQAAQGKAYVAGDMTMTGRQLYPLGDMGFEELVDIYKEQARALYEGGVDLFVVETMMSLQETRACVLAIKEVCDLPVMASLTFEKDGRTLYGTPPEAAVVTLQALGADAVGLNCSTGPGDMAPIVQKMYEYADVPILAKPNAGLPDLQDGCTVYHMTPEEFGREAALLVQAGARIVGGCCGTTPEHIGALCRAVREMRPLPVRPSHERVLASERQVVEISLDGPFQVIGERINPTGKKKLQEALREGKMELVREIAREQEKNGAVILDINVGTNGIDEKATMVKAVYEVTNVSALPLSIDSSYPDVIEGALRVYPGRGLINSISFEKEKMEKIFPIAKKYGAMFIALPLSDEGIPETLEKKHAVLDALLEKAYAYGFSAKDVVVDGLAATVGAAPTAALDCLSTFAYCKKKLGLPTVCGLSNISFGLPERTYVNGAFLAMAISGGLTMAIANPSQDMLMNIAAAANMLMNKEGAHMAYIKQMQAFSEKETERKGNAPAVVPEEKKSAAVSNGADDSLRDDPLYKAVLEGEKETAVRYAERALQQGMDPKAIVDDLLIPAINKVGDLYERQVYFLPQLIASANAMEQAIARVEPLLVQKGEGKASTIVIATVEGDVHDIGKNLVGLMLRNYGYRVVDLGKDVPAAAIVSAALEQHAAVIGLSALMTTTMMRMKDVVAEAAKRGYAGKIIIGGAAVTPSFSDEIGADGYSSDAADCVKLVSRLLA